MPRISAVNRRYRCTRPSFKPQGIEGRYMEYLRSITVILLFICSYFYYLVTIKTKSVNLETTRWGIYFSRKKFIVKCIIA